MELNEKFKDLLEKRNALKQRNTQALQQKREKQEEQLKLYAKELTDLVSELREYGAFTKANGIYLDAEIDDVDKSGSKIDMRLSNGTVDIMVIRNEFGKMMHNKFLSVGLGDVVQIDNVVRNEITTKMISTESGELKTPVAAVLRNASKMKEALNKAVEAELENQIKALSNGEAVEPKTFAYQIAYNLIPQIGGEQMDGYTSEEMKLHFEGRKIMHLPEMNVSCTCVRVPVMRSHSISVKLHFDRPVSVEAAREVLKDAPGVKLVDDLANKRYPMPLETSDQDLVFVGRIRPDLIHDCGIALWCCGDQVRKGAALNAIQIAELLVK